MQALVAQRVSSSFARGVVAVARPAVLARGRIGLKLKLGYLVLVPPSQREEAVLVLVRPVAADDQGSRRTWIPAYAGWAASVWTQLQGQRERAAVVADPPACASASASDDVQRVRDLVNVDGDESDQGAERVSVRDDDDDPAAVARSRV